MLPPPNTCGLPDKFSTWRPGQAEAIAEALESDARVLAITMPTGSGKSLIAMAYALLSGRRAVYLTSTKGLQEQLTGDFRDTGLFDVRGSSNYPCLASGRGGLLSAVARDKVQCDQGPCHHGIPCDLRKNGCLYYDAVREASNAQLVVTNYAFWISVNRYAEGLGERDLVILDEAHAAPDELASHLTISLTQWEAERVAGLGWSESEDPEYWRRWAVTGAGQLRQELDDTVSQLTQATSSERRKKQEVATKLNELCQIREDWIVEHGYQGKKKEPCVTFGPVDVAPYAEDRLFLGADKLLFTSATLRPKTLALLGLNPRKAHLHEAGSSFPVSRRPIIHIPTVRLDNRTTQEGLGQWLHRIDQILRRRQDRKGIIHTTSYHRQQLVLNNSSFAGTMLAHGSFNTRERIALFKRSPAPLTLVSPSVTTGYDFPASECEFQIIGKVPFPDTRSKIIKARQAKDPEYGPYLAMQTVVQTAGRGMRSERDQLETFLIDDHFVWFLRKFAHLAPQWFLEAVEWASSIPSPPSTLNKEIVV